MKLLTDASSDIFGTIESPVTSIPNDPIQAVSSLISAGIQIFIFVAAITMLIYLLLGAFEWITSSGEKEKITKAQLKITNAVVGIIVIIIVLTVFCLATTEILHLSDTCFSFKIPTIAP